MSDHLAHRHQLPSGGPGLTRLRGAGFLLRRRVPSNAGSYLGSTGVYPLRPTDGEHCGDSSRLEGADDNLFGSSCYPTSPPMVWGRLLIGAGPFLGALAVGLCRFELRSSDRDDVAGWTVGAVEFEVEQSNRDGVTWLASSDSRRDPAIGTTPTGAGDEQVEFEAGPPPPPR
jgi:hypothetical protein